MLNAKDTHGNLLSDEQHMINWGLFLHSTSFIDLSRLSKRGMSLLGPQSLLVQLFLLYYERKGCKRKLRSGVTELAQVNGRKAFSWEQKYANYARYVFNRNMWLDLKTLIGTIKNTFVRQDLDLNSQATAESFKGSINE